MLTSLKNTADRLIASLRAPEPARVSKTPDAQALPPAPAQAKPKPAVKSANYADPKRIFSAIAAPAGRQVLPPPANANWTYDVYFGPNWGKAGQLAFQTQTQDKGGLGASMAWSPNGGAPKVWFLGVVEPDHPTHANTRFPGFFMHPAYFPQALVPGSRLLWEFPWQGSDGKTRAERVRRFDMKVIAWERVRTAAGEFDAAHLEGTLRYMEGETVRAEVRYGLWYAPRAMQIVRVLWEGRAPDESQAEMIAELAFQRVP